MKEVHLEAQGAGHYLLAGELSFNTVPDIASAFDKMIDNADELILDLQGVTRTDSAGLALLMEWMRIAHQRHKRIVLRNMPAQMLAVAKVSELDHILPLV
ncbi:MAG TPA: STAS domain-containing protein [Gammaproteobacteria bacterium]